MSIDFQRPMTQKPGPYIAAHEVRRGNFTDRDRSLSQIGEGVSE
jgi:hypothetical protein